MMKPLPYTYKCPKCENKVSVISNTYPPICNNKEVHSTVSVKMELQNVRTKINN